MNKTERTWLIIAGVLVVAVLIYKLPDFARTDSDGRIMHTDDVPVHDATDVPIKDPDPAQYPQGLPSWCKNILDVPGDFFDLGTVKEYRIYAGIDVPRYSLSYYRNYFSSDNETHYIVDLDGMTWKITVEDAINVECHAPVEAEDKNLDLLGSGELLFAYNVDKTQGSVRQIFGERWSEDAPENGSSLPEDNEIYVGDKTYKVFHKYGCLFIGDEDNTTLFYDKRQNVIDRGYSPCVHCHP